MPIDAPDFVQWQQPIEVVATLPTPPSPALETPFVQLARYEGASTDFQSIIIYQVGTGKQAILEEISMISDNFDKTLWALSIKGVTQFSNKLLQSSLTIVFPSVRMTAGDYLYLDARSSDGTTIKADAMLSGKEVG